VFLLAVIAILVLARGNASLVPVAQTSPRPTFTAIPRQAINETCVKQVAPFVSSLESLDSGVGPNITFGDYSQMFAAAQSARGQVNISELDPPCISVYAAAQAVLGEHAEAYNSWNDCNATTGCSRESIESSLEGHWASARATLANVKASMP
jgi:hypothetical protein